MSIKVENTENTNELKLTFNVPAETFDEGMKKVYAKTAKYFNIKGFRKGKAPMALVEKTYGPEIFYEDTFNEIVPEIFEKEVEENKLEVVSKPQIDIVQMGKGKELIFTAVVQVKPEVKLGKYKGISLKKVEYKVTDEDINNELNNMANKNSRLVSIENEPVAEKDIAVIDFEGFVDGVAFEGGKAENHELEIGSKTFIPGFEDQIIGMKIEDEKDINVKFPEEYFSAELAGKDAKPYQLQYGSPPLFPNCVSATLTISKFLNTSFHCSSYFGFNKSFNIFICSSLNLYCAAISCADFPLISICNLISFSLSNDLCHFISFISQ